jgi:hypothetical protein
MDTIPQIGQSLVKKDADSKEPYINHLYANFSENSDET